MKHVYLVLAAACFAIAFADHNYREFATAGGLFVVADAIARLRGPRAEVPPRV